MARKLPQVLLPLPRLQARRPLSQPLGNRAISLSTPLGNHLHANKHVISPQQLAPCHHRGGPSHPTTYQPASTCARPLSTKTNQDRYHSRRLPVALPAPEMQPFSPRKA